jgi:hypothetical protein
MFFLNFDSLTAWKWFQNLHAYSKFLIAREELQTAPLHQIFWNIYVKNIERNERKKEEEAKNLNKFSSS